MEIDIQKSRSLTLVFWLILILSPLVWLWPRLVHPAFGMIDDPSDLTYIESIKNNFTEWWHHSGFHGEPDRGRMMPVHWLLRLVFYLLPAGFNPFGWAFIHYINFIISISTAFWAVKMLTGKNSTAILTCLLFIFNRNTIVNYFRLGTQEVTQVLWLGIMFLFAQCLTHTEDGTRKRVLGALIAIVCFLFYFTKETAIVMFPVSLIMLLGSLWIKRGKREWTAFFILNLCLFTLQRVLSPPIAGYASHFQPSIPLMVANAKMYFAELQWHYLFIGASCSYMYRLYENHDRLDELDVEYWQFLFLLLGSCFFVIFLPWTEHVSRYMLVASYLLCFFSALEIQQILTFDNPRKYISVAVAAFLAFASPAGMVDTIRDIYARANEKSPVDAIQWLSINAEKNSEVLVLEMEKEPLYSTLEYLQGTFKRKDIKVHSLSSFSHDFPTFNIQPLDEIPPDLFDRIDYVFWTRKGAVRAGYDELHQQIMQRLSQSRYQKKMQSVYSELFDSHNGYPEGTEIWKLTHDERSRT